MHNGSKGAMCLWEGVEPLLLMEGSGMLKHCDLSAAKSVIRYLDLGRFPLSAGYAFGRAMQVATHSKK